MNAFEFINFAAYGEIFIRNVIVVFSRGITVTNFLYFRVRWKKKVIETIFKVLRNAFRYFFLFDIFYGMSERFMENIFWDFVKQKKYC
jgi:hypothetical protein